MFGMNGFHVSASGAIQGHHGPLVKCDMERGISTEEMVVKPADFQSSIEVNLDGTD